MAVDHNNPQSRDEEILIATIDGTEYDKIPQSRIEELLLELKEVIEEGGSGGGGIRPIGVTTTPLYDGSTTNPIQINGESYTAETGDMVTYQSTEFLFNVNEVWQELGDVSIVLAIIDNIFADIAQAFDATDTYAVDDYVIYNDQLYKCTTAHTGAWDENDFTVTTISDEITDVSDAVDEIKDGQNIDSFADVETALADKVNKVDGKGLSTNDYDDTEKASVAAATSAISAMKDGTDIDSFGDVEIALLDKADISDLGTAAAKDSTNAVTSGSTDLVESGAVKDAIDAAVSSAYHHAGTKTVAQLTHDLLIAANEGNVYNITDSGTTTSDFIEGIGKTIDEGSNVGICKVGDVYMFDLLSGFVDTTNFVQKSQTSGLIKNDGTVNDEIEEDVDSLKSGLTNISSDIEELQAYTGYSSTDIIGIEVDYVNKSFRRLGAAVGKNGGSDFDAFPMFGGRRRCNVADDGTISKYYGDTGYAEDGSNGQVMVYQPKFYYKVVPLKLEKQSTGKGYHIRKAAYYITATPMKGFKVHPAFVNASGNEVDYILVGASKGCIYDVSESAYILDDAQVMDNTADKFSSIFGVKPASGLTQDLTRVKIEQMCQNRGANWHEVNIQIASMTQLLMLIEYGKFDMQRAIGKGVVDITDNSSYNCGATSGSTSALGNASGRATSTTIVTNTSTTYTDDGKTSVTYRGEEDPYGDMWEFVMGMNIYGNGSMNGGEPYICSDYDYAESKNTGNYKGAGFTVANSDGYVNAWGYGSEDFDWLFIASEVGGSDALPVGDYLWKTADLNGYRIALLGAYWNDSWKAGAFCWTLGTGVGYRSRAVAGRLAYIPA